MLDGYSISDTLRRGESGARQLFLITGGCGFIGSHLADLLVARGHVVRVLDDLSHGRREHLPRGVEFIEGDVADPVALRRAIQDADGCFHLAAISSVAECHSRWLEAHRTNLTGTINVFDAARRARPTMPVPVVYASSAAVYGDQGSALLSETLMPRPISAAGADKAGCELHARIAHAAHRVPTLGLRFFNVYGPRQSAAALHAGVVPYFCERLADRRDISIFGDGDHTRDFVYVADAVAALVAAMERVDRECDMFNICTGTATTILDLARAVGQACGAEPEISFRAPRSSDVRYSAGNPARARERLAFRAGTDLETGLALTLRAANAVGAV
jgi:UDP-glucose 4-epimerase